MSSDHEHLQLLLERLRAFELRLPLPHERPIVEIARAALSAEIAQLSHRLYDLRYTERRAGSRSAAC